MLVYIVAELAPESGQNTSAWILAVLFFGIFGLALFFYDMSRQSPQHQKEPATALRVSCDVLNENKEEKRVTMVIRSNSTVQAKQQFKESCASKGLVLTGEPSISIESNE
jgi:hypothetical protein